MPNEVYEWTLSGLLAGQFVQTVQHLRYVVATPINPFFSALTLADFLIQPGGSIEQLLNCLPEDYRATSLRVRKVDGAGGPTAIRLAAEFAVSDGTRTGEISSAQVNPVIIWIPSTTPDKTGRLFLPGVSEDDIDEMALVAGLVSLINVFATAYATANSVGTDTAQGTVWRRASATDDLIVAGQVSPLIGTQRRRLHPV